jgi:hypothetical protein
MVICRLTGTVPAVSIRTVEDVLSLLGQYPLTGEGAALTRRAIASARPVAAHAPALLQQTIITHARGTVM